MKKRTTIKGKRPQVSILMPVYNAAPYLSDAIESIRKQTLRNWELLIVDDASTDSSAKIITAAARADKRIRVFRNRTNQGLVKSLNKLIPLTRGIFVARMDADDISLPKRLQKQVTFLRRHPDLVACGGQELIIDEKGVNIAYKYFPTEPELCYRMITNFMVIQPPLLMAWGDLFRKLRYENHIFKNDDISMHFKLLRHGGFGNVDDVIFKYRKRLDSITHRDPKRVFFLALAVRINAMRFHGYRPPVINALMLLAETVIVAILPNQVLISMFELIRHTTRFDLRLANKPNFGVAAAIS
jgi:glycosyltransferase involved in cell wall biosynthesis